MKFQYQMFVAMLLLAASDANAQKLPATQQISLRAPANIKIDGKATEWNDTFQALNHNCDIYYTICNDDNNLYLIVQSNDIAVIRRMLNGGITFSVNTAGKKDDKAAIGITYPVLDSPVGINPPKGALSDKEADSLANLFNKRMREKAKTIKNNGIKGIDTAISVYNDNGIEAAEAFNRKMAYTCELSVPLKHFGLTPDHLTPFAYHVMINEVAQHGIEIKKDAGGAIISISVNKGAQMGQPATDFWGEYTLAKK